LSLLCRHRASALPGLLSSTPRLYVGTPPSTLTLHSSPSTGKFNIIRPPLQLPFRTQYAAIFPTQNFPSIWPCLRSMPAIPARSCSLSISGSFFEHQCFCVVCIRAFTFLGMLFALHGVSLLRLVQLWLSFVHGNKVCVFVASSDAKILTQRFPCDLLRLLFGLWTIL